MSVVDIGSRNPGLLREIRIPFVPCGKTLTIASHTPVFSLAICANLKIFPKERQRERTLVKA